MDTKNLKTKTEYTCAEQMRGKSTELISILANNFSGKLNLARIKFLALFLCALCKAQTVNFEKLATAFESGAMRTSSLRRIQRFMAEYFFDSDLIARLIFKLLPHQPPYRLVIDRTNWKFGDNEINVLALAIVYHGVSFPIMISMLNKRGNSNTKERIKMIDRYIRLFGCQTIDCLLADREFVGENWVEYLNNNKIRYYIRIRDVDDPRNKKRFRCSMT